MKTSQVCTHLITKSFSFMRFPRTSGILLHPTSLPGPFGSGDLGQSSYHFVEWLKTAGQSLWQMLPLCPAGMGNSPYMGLSAFAGNPLLIDLQDLANKGWVSPHELSSSSHFYAHRVDFRQVNSFRMEKLRQAAITFFSSPKNNHHTLYEEFCEAKKSWLDDYALFMALNEHHGKKEWVTWDESLTKRKPDALKKAQKELSQEISFWKFLQWCFFFQWHALKKYANERGVHIVGDIPIFIAHQSADVWANPELFFLDANLRPTVVAGVPPDYFSETGQRWGNPLYRWDVMEEKKYSWWIERIKTTLELVDVLRIDHFRGFAEYWEIPASEKTAVHGRWVEGPRHKLFNAIKKKLGELPIIAEDLGLMTSDVIELRDAFNFPGMKILQFAFSDNPKNLFLPHNYVQNTVAYTGTHDNDTTQGWFHSATEKERDFAKRYFSSNGHEIHWDMIHSLSQSVADIVIYPFQDILGLGTDARMNIPGKSGGNWEWRFVWKQVEQWHALRLRELTFIGNRCL